MTERLTFIDTEQTLDVTGSIEHVPLSITITGPSTGHIQSYDMNENELFALFNLLHDILKRSYSKKLKKLQQLVLHGDSTEDIR